MRKSDRRVSQALKDLRDLVEEDADPIVRRIAYAVEQGIRWAREDTVGWPDPANDVRADAALLRQELERLTTGTEALASR